MTLLLTDPPTSKAPPAPARPAPLSTSPAAWVVYTADDKRQLLPAALLDSVADHTARYGAPSAVLLHPTDLLTLAPDACAVGLLPYTPTPGGVTVQAGTWGLA